MKLLEIVPERKGNRYKFTMTFEDVDEQPTVTAEELLDLDKLRLAILEQIGRYFDGASSTYNWKDDVKKSLNDYWKVHNPRITKVDVVEVQSELFLPSCNDEVDHNHHQIVS